MIRILRICSTAQLILEETERLRAIMKANGYPQHIIRRGIREGEVIVTRLRPQKQTATVRKQSLFHTRLLWPSKPRSLLLMFVESARNCFHASI